MIFLPSFGDEKLKVDPLETSGFKATFLIYKAFNDAVHLYFKMMAIISPHFISQHM